MFDMKGFHISASGAIQDHHGPLVTLRNSVNLPLRNIPAKLYCYPTSGLGIEYFLRSLAPLAVGQRAYVMVCCPSCVRLSGRLYVCPSVR